MTGLTLVTLAVVAAALLGRITYGQALAIGGATPSGAAVIAGTTVVPTFYAIATGAAAGLGLALLRRSRSLSREHQRFPPGTLILVLFLVWSTGITLAAPLLFNGLPVLNSTTSQLSAGHVSSSNVAQILYLLLGVCVVVYLARSRDTGPGLVGIALGLCLGLSFARYIANTYGLPFPEGFFDSSPNFNYIESAAGGLKRVRGITSEPAALALECVTGVAYFLPRATFVTGWRRAGCLALGAVAVFLGIVSTSATFVVAGVISLAIILGITMFDFLGRRVSASLAIGVAGCVVVIVGALLFPTALDFVRSTINDKVGTSSYDARSSADSVSLRIFMQTYGLGVGLGSARASSFLPTLLSATGVIGAVLYFAAIVTTGYAARRDPTVRPVGYALVAFMVVKLTSAPDISDSTGLLWICIGVLSHAALRTQPVPDAVPELVRA